MAHVLIAVADMRYRRDLADVLTATGHHVATTSHPVLALSALLLSERQLIVLLDDTLLRRTPARDDRHDQHDGAVDQKALPTWLIEKLNDTRHVYIVLTARMPGELPPEMRNLFETGKAVAIAPSSSTSALLTTIEVAAGQTSISRIVPLISRNAQCG